MHALIVDDDPMIRMLVKEILDLEGFSTETHESGENLLKEVETSQTLGSVDLIIIDRIMPGLTGIEVVSALRQRADTQSIPIIMLTGEATSENILEGYNVGADYYITKPFTRQQLLYGLKLVLNGEKNP